jgi:hypothetical protein
MTLIDNIKGLVNEMTREYQCRCTTRTSKVARDSARVDVAKSGVTGPGALLQVPIRPTIAQSAAARKRGPRQCTVRSSEVVPEASGSELLT